MQGMLRPLARRAAHSGLIRSQDVRATAVGLLDANWINPWANHFSIGGAGPCRHAVGRGKPHDHAIDPHRVAQ